MALNCESLLTADIQRDCDNRSVAGLEVNILLFNIADIDKASVTFDATTDLLMTNFQLLSGKTGYLLEGARLNSNGTSYELVKTDQDNAFKHKLSGVVFTPTVENKKSIETIVSGGRYLVLVEKVWKGAESKSAYELYGYAVGMEGETLTYNSNEANGTITFELATADGYEEGKIPFNVLHTDYATTKTAFDNKFAQA